MWSSPACILSFFITSLSRGEFSEAWSWSDELEDKADATVAPAKDVSDVSSIPAKESNNGASEGADEGVSTARPESSMEGTEKKRRSKRKQS